VKSEKWKVENGEWRMENGEESQILNFE